MYDRDGVCHPGSVGFVDEEITPKDTQMSHRDSQPTTEELDEDDEIPVRHVQTVPIRKDTNGTYRATLTSAIRAAGLGDGAMFRFIPEGIDDLGVVPALGAEDGDSRLRDQRTYTVEGAGATGTALRLTIPEAALDALGIDTDPDSEATRDGEPPLLDVFAGDRMIAFDTSNAISLGDVFSDEYATENAPDADKVILDQIQTTTPRMRGANVTVAVSPALRHAGDRTGSIEYRPDLADELGGVVPAILHEERTDGRAENNTYTVYREGADREDFVISLPEHVLDALDLSATDYEDVPREERPALAVYAGEGLIALARPGEREVAVDRTQTPGDRAPTLIDVDGVGPALADRLPTHGYDTIEDLAAATREELLAVDDLGEKRADRIMADIDDWGEGNTDESDQEASNG